jgi:hemin uptake protein HemP
MRESNKLERRSDQRGGMDQGAVDCLDSRTIFGDKSEVLIRHGDQMYRLKKTRYGKLILNK